MITACLPDKYRGYYTYYDIGDMSGDNLAYEKGVNPSQHGKYEAGRTNITIGSSMAWLVRCGIKLEDCLSEELVNYIRQ